MIQTLLVSIAFLTAVGFLVKKFLYSYILEISGKKAKKHGVHDCSSCSFNK